MNTPNINGTTLSPTRTVAVKVVWPALKIIKDNGGEMQLTDLLKEIPKHVQLNEYDTYVFEKTGYTRWRSIFHFLSVALVKAGYLVKRKGKWILTGEGERALKLGPEGLVLNTLERYNAWRKENKKEEQPIDEESATESLEETQNIIIDQLESQAKEAILDFLKRKSPYEFQDIVAELLKAMGYHIALLATKGPDQGIDVIAYSDPLGTKPPRILVQVKHRPDATVSSDDIQRLAGTLKRESDVGIFVTSGKFSDPAAKEARSSHKHIELIDFDRFVTMWQEYYEKMNDEQKAYLPLKKVFVLAED